MQNEESNLGNIEHRKPFNDYVKRLPAIMKHLDFLCLTRKQ